MKKVRKNPWDNSKFRKKQIEAIRKGVRTPEHKKAVSKQFKELWKDPEYRKEMSKERKERWADPEYKEKMSKKRKEFCKDPKNREKLKKSKETREKLRQINLGKKMSEETKEKIRKKLIGRKNSPETIEKKRKAGLGRKHSEETKKKIGLASKGRKLSIKSREKLSRSVVKAISKRNKVKRFQGYFYSDKNKKDFFYRSTYELKTLMKLENNKNILSYEIEYFRIKYKFNKINRIYIPDFWIIMKGGREYILEVKARWLINDPLNVAKIKAAKEFCQKNNMKFILWTEKTLGGAYYDRKGKYHMSLGK